MKLIRKLFLAVLAFAAWGVRGQELNVSADKPGALYQTNEQVTWSISGAVAGTKPEPFVVLDDGLTTNLTGMLVFTNGKAAVTATLGHPGTLLLEVIGDSDTNYGGAALSWKDIKPSLPEPEDFDAFWKEKLAELAAIPLDPKLEEVDAGSTDVRLWKITMNNIRGTHIYGYLARPKGDAPCPAMLQVQSAGVYPIDKRWVIEAAKNGWLTLSIMPHDLPTDREPAFYEELKEGALKHYSTMGANDRNQIYFLRMYLACYRSVDYLTNRLDWNHKAMLVTGGSQGGLQTIMTAGLHPAVTMATAHLPAGCDHTGPLIGRAPGWPNLLGTSEGVEREARVKTARYYDMVNFAARVHCPILIAVGLIDTTCPPAGIFAMYNRINAPKRIVILPKVSHHTGQGSSATYMAVKSEWLNAAKNDQPPPLQ